MWARARLALATLTTVCVVLTGCSDPSGEALTGGSEDSEPAQSEVSVGDGPVYNSIDALTENAEVVVLGTVGDVRGTEVDDGGTGDGDGIDVTFHSVVVDEVLDGRATTVQAGDTLAVAVSDPPSETSEGNELSEGDETVLFLEELTPAEAPGIDTEDVFYVIIGMAGNGAFDVEDDTVTARSDAVHGMTDTEATTDGPFTATLDELRTFFSDR